MNGFQVNRLTHTRDDACGIKSYYSQSVGPGKYLTTNGSAASWATITTDPLPQIMMMMGA